VDELWGGIDLAQAAEAKAGAPLVAADDKRLVPAFELLVDGQKADPELAAKGVIFMPLSQAAREHPDLVRRHLFSQVSTDRDKFAAAHAALFSGGTLLYVPDNVVLDRPILGQFWSSGGGAAILPHTLILAGKNSRFNYLDEFLSPSLERAAAVRTRGDLGSGIAASESTRAEDSNVWNPRPRRPLTVGLDFSELTLHGAAISGFVLPGLLAG